jgi:hypothetical protein
MVVPVKETLAALVPTTFEFPIWSMFIVRAVAPPL